MRVLHVIPAVAPRYGGPSHAVIGMARAVFPGSADVLIATTDADGPRHLRVPLESPTDWHGVPTLFFEKQWSEAWKYSRPLARWLDAHAGAFDVAHIHAVFSHACVAAATACRRRRVPYIVRPLGTLDPWSLQQKSLRKRVLWHGGVKQMLRAAAAIHYTTAMERQLAEAPLGLHGGVVVPLGVDDAMFDARGVTPGLSEIVPGLGDSPYVLTLGRLHPKKGLELLVDAFVRATQQADSSHWRLVIAGDGEQHYVDRLKRHVRERQADARVIFAGWLGGMDKVAALRGAAVLGLASHQENFGLVVAEALACGTPVIVSTHVNLAHEIHAADAGWVVSLDPSDLAAALSECLQQSDLRTERGARGRTYARAHFRWSRIGADLLDLYGWVKRARV